MMKRIYKHAIFTTFFILSAVILSVSAAQAQHGYRLEKPLKFAAGKNSKTVKARLANEQEAHEYKLKARKGQKLSIFLSANNEDMTFLVLNARDEIVDEFAGDDWDKVAVLPYTGEYKINVSANRGKGDYTLFVKIK